MLVLATLPVGKSDEHLAYPDTLSLPYDVLGKVCFEMAKSAWRTGIRKIVFWNSRRPALIDGNGLSPAAH
jgi:creatinine amidohydrolase